MKVLPKNILVVKNRALGDSIMGLSSINYLKSILPNSKITYGIQRWTHPLYTNCNNDADEILPIEIKGLCDIFTLFRILRKKKYDLIIELHQTGRTSKIFKIFSLLTKIKYIYHNHNHKYGTYILNQGVRRPSIQRDLDCCYSALTNYLSMNIPIPSYLDFPPVIKSKNEKREKLITLGVVATRESKMWPLEYYAKLIDIISKEFGDYHFIIPISKSSQDIKIKNRLLKIGVNKRVDFIENSLAKLPELISKSSIYIGNDTGLKHLSVALGLKTFTFFGPEEPLEWHPYDTKNHKYFFIKNLSCRVKNSHYCGVNSCENHLCLKKITVNTVFESLKSILIPNKDTD